MREAAADGLPVGGDGVVPAGVAEGGCAVLAAVPANAVVREPVAEKPTAIIHDDGGVRHQQEALLAGRQAVDQLGAGTLAAYEIRHDGVVT